VLDIDVVVFDVLGTMVDEPAGIARGIRRSQPDLGIDEIGRRTDAWLAYVEEQQRLVVVGEREYAGSSVIDAEAAALVGADPTHVRLDPWPDSGEGLTRIATTYPVVGLSNADRPALYRLSAHAGLRWHATLSAADARTYKPQPAVYRLAVDLAGTSPDRLLMVAAHAWDLRGAQSVGMRTAYVARQAGDPPGPGDAFDHTASGLTELADLIGA
jgi:2-haloacid dehalogenase